MSSEIETLRNEIDELRALKREADLKYNKQIEEYSKDRNQIYNQLSITKRSVIQNQSELIKLKKSFKQYNEKVALLEAQYSQLLEQISIDNDIKQSLNRSIIEEENKLAILKSETQETISSIKAQISNGTSELEGVSENIKFNKHQCQIFSNQDEQLSAQLTELREAISKYKDLSEQLNYSHKAALQETGQTTKRYNTLQEKLSTRNIQISNLQQLISVIKHKNSKL